VYWVDIWLQATSRGVDEPLRFVVNAQEVKLGSRRCFVSVWCAGGDVFVCVEAATPPSTDGVQETRRLLFDSIFGEVDGYSLSFMDRAKLGMDDPSFAFSSVNCASFQKILVDAGAADGQVFYDLGCGAGHSLVAALLTGIRFMRVIGIELLPSLGASARKSVETVKRAVLGQAGSLMAHVPDASSVHALRAGLPLLEIR
jgi:hypothetical protein